MHFLVAVMLAQASQNIYAPTIQDANLAPGSVINVEIRCNVDNSLGLIAADFVVLFDESVLSFMYGTFGNFFNSPFVANNSLDGPGRYWLSGLSLGPPVFSGTYTVVTLTFVVMSWGTGPLTIEAFAPGTPPIYLDGLGDVVFADPVVNGSFSNVVVDVAVANATVGGTGTMRTIAADVSNQGSGAATFNVEFVVGGQVVGTVPVASLPAGQTTNASRVWDTTGWSGTNLVEVRVAPLAGETDVSDNVASTSVTFGGMFTAGNGGDSDGRSKCGGSAGGAANAAAMLAALAVMAARYLLK